MSTAPSSPVGMDPSAPRTAPFIDLRAFPVDRTAGRLLPEDLARKIGGVCLTSPAPGFLNVAVVDPSQVYIYDHVQIATRGRFKAHLVQADPDLIELAQDFVYRVPETLGEPWGEWLERQRLRSRTLDPTAARLQPEAQASITERTIGTFARLLKEAIALGATVLHLLPTPDGLDVRHRRYGLLETADRIPSRAEGQALVKHLKSLAGMELLKEMIQSGQTSLRVGDDEYLLRVSVMPTAFGESATLRILSRGPIPLRLDELGLEPDQLERYRGMYTSRRGLLVVSGPGGSGRSVTLYATMAALSGPELKLASLEDPLEYHLPGALQVEVDSTCVDADRRITYSRALREFLRQDSDVIMVSALRGSKVARLCLEAVRTGHLILSGVYGEDAVSVLWELRDLGIPTHRVAASLVGSVNQRLVRRICATCREEVEATAAQQRALRAHGFVVDRLHVGRGCPDCRRTGFRGRVGVFQVFPISEGIREVLEQGGNRQEVTLLARSEGMSSLLQRGLAKAVRGETTLEEVLRVCPEDTWRRPGTPAPY